MFTRHVQKDDKMGSVFGYVIVTASESKPHEVTTMDNLADKPNADAPADRVDVAACNKIGAALTKVIAAKEFKGLKFEKNECTGTMRTIVHHPRSMRQPRSPPPQRSARASRSSQLAPTTTRSSWCSTAVTSPRICSHGDSSPIAPVAGSNSASA
jgi:hypothetical protein